MSILAENTERKAILGIAKLLRHFSRFDFLLLCAEDAQALRQAENLLKGIVETNGYTTRFSKTRGTGILKFKP
ncbi:hypothetical protein [Pedobacter sp. Leaf194]|uniref:hypothetical protein n=1 Tax=Pedobacter sp. Leaf194 TaxID=1736297 RepID=UPI000703BA07|nr:hypothetical protein [Pedobacter sp. Leaf194]KQS36820.1 hypothetical protein ASG14_07220 [Pedobacter sp. Leaf194]